MRSIGLVMIMWCCFAAIATPSRVAAARGLETCRAANFELDQIRSRQQRGRAYIVGRVVNNCDVETGVEIKLVILDGAGAVVHTSDFWPASSENIPAHSGFAFQTEIEGVGSFDRFQVSVVEVRRWAE
jgi:hypothetical protein